MTDKFVQEVMESSKETIKEAVKKQVEENITTNLYWSIKGEIETVVKEYMEKEIIPEVKKRLSDDKEPIIDATAKAITEATKVATIELGKKMAENAAKKISGYGGNDILKKLFMDGF